MWANNVCSKHTHQVLHWGYPVRARGLPDIHFRCLGHTGVQHPRMPIDGIALKGYLLGRAMGEMKHRTIGLFQNMLTFLHC